MYLNHIRAHPFLHLLLGLHHVFLLTSWSYYLFNLTEASMCMAAKLSHGEFSVTTLLEERAPPLLIGHQL